MSPSRLKAKKIGNSPGVNGLHHHLQRAGRLRRCWARYRRGRTGWPQTRCPSVRPFLSTLRSKASNDATSVGSLSTVITGFSAPPLAGVEAGFFLVRRHPLAARWRQTQTAGAAVRTAGRRPAAGRQNWRYSQAPSSQRQGCHATCRWHQPPQPPQQPLRCTTASAAKPEAVECGGNGVSCGHALHCHFDWPLHPR
jgi:hypothetical protein